MIKLIERLDLGTGIDWWDKNRSRINEVIESFNEWQIIHRFDEFEKEVVKAQLKLCRKYGEDNNFSDWQFELLDEMEEFISEKENEL